MTEVFVARHPEESAIVLPVARVRERSRWKRLLAWLRPRRKIDPAVAAALPGEIDFADKMRLLDLDGTAADVAADAAYSRPPPTSAPGPLERFSQ